MYCVRIASYMAPTNSTLRVYGFAVVKEENNPIPNNLSSNVYKTVFFNSSYRVSCLPKTPCVAPFVVQLLEQMKICNIAEFD